MRNALSIFIYRKDDMIYCLRLTTLLATLLSITFSSTTFAISPSVSEVKDTRTTGKFFAGCEVEVSLVGDEMTDVIAMRKLLSLPAIRLPSN